MGFKNIGRAAACLVFSVAPGVVLANQFPVVTSCLGPVEFDGRHYEVVGSPGILWDAADTAATNKTFLGVQGHLATITSEAEDRFVESLRRCARNTNKPGTTTKLLERDSVWVGGFQEPCENEPKAEPGCGWKWVNNEGSISTPDFPLPSYSNWLTTDQGPQPNDTIRNGLGEDHLTVGLRGLFGWNDESSTGNIGGYIIEYNTSSDVSVIDCIGDGCETTAGQTLLLPPDVDPNGKIGVRTFEFTDPRFNPDGTCKQETLTLFDDQPDRPDLFIPAYLCGSPKFLVVEIKKSDEIKIAQGTIIVENNPELALPGNLYVCKGELGPNGDLPVEPLDPLRDPQKRDVVAWQATDSTMLEAEFGGAENFPGALGEFTFECGSSRGLTRNLSYLVIGMHINFGSDFETQSEDVNNRFVALTGYKLELLRVSVEQSRSSRALKNGDSTRLRSHITNAIKFHREGQFASALNSIEEFLGKVANSVYKDVDGENYNGEHLMRANNIRFTYMEKVIPFAQ